MQKTLIAIVLDESGSMSPLQGETISALNKFIEEQKAIPGDALFTLVKFNGDYSFIHNSVSLAEVKPITTADYSPSGYTALLDAMGRTIDETGKKLAAMSDGDRPEKTIIVVMTDGQENVSKEYTRDQVLAKVKHQTEKYGWQFLFLGAGPDAISQGVNLGIHAASAMSYNATQKGVGVAMNSTSAAVRSSRLGGGQASYTNQDRKDNS